MPYLLVRDTDGREILTRDISPDEYETYYHAWMDAETVRFSSEGPSYTLHSIARTRPERNLVLCVSPCVSPMALDPSDD